jgi:hypothetical protein
MQLEESWRFDLTFRMKKHNMLFLILSFHIAKGVLYEVISKLGTTSKGILTFILY